MKWKDKLNKKYFDISLYCVVSAAVIFILFQITNNAAYLFGQLIDFLGATLKVLSPVIYGFVFAYLTKPLLTLIEKLFAKSKLSAKATHVISLILTLLLFVAFVSAIFMLLIYSVTSQLELVNTNDIIEAISQLIDTIDDFYVNLLTHLDLLNIKSAEVSDFLSQATSISVEFVRGLFDQMLGMALNLSGYISTLFFSLIIGVYFLSDAQTVTAFLGRLKRAVCSERADRVITKNIADLHRVFSGYIKGQLADILFMAVAITVVLSLIGVKFSAIIGILTGVAQLVPYLGPFVAYALTILVCLVGGDYYILIAALIAILIIQVVDANLIEPRFLGKSIKIHPLLVLIFLIIGNAIGGLLGMLLAVPIGSYLRILFVSWLEYREQKKGIQPQAIESATRIGFRERNRHRKEQRRLRKDNRRNNLQQAIDEAAEESDDDPQQPL